MTPASNRKERRLLCPMHPQVQSDKPGTCPICNMNLEKAPPEKEQAPSPGAPASKEGPPRGDRKILYWTDPMLPGFKSDKPGKSPMGMDLIPVYEEESPAAKALPPGTVRIAPQTQQLIGVEYGEVTEAAAIQNHPDGWPADLRRDEDRPHSTAYRGLDRPCLRGRSPANW